MAWLERGNAKIYYEDVGEGEPIITTHVILDGIGHMTAIEDPQRTIKEILEFLETVKETGKAG